MRLKIFICLLLAGVTLAIYWPARHYGVVDFDDPLLVTDNAEINSGLTWHSLWWALSGVLVANWHPVTSLSFVLTHQWLGINPGAEHLVNMIFHAANAALLFLVLQRMTRFRWGEATDELSLQNFGRPGAARGYARPTASGIPVSSTWRCALVAAMFAWHPLRVESVAWIAERKDVLCGFFFLLALFFYAGYARQVTSLRPASARHASDKWRVARTETAAAPDSSQATRHPALCYWLALVCFVLALMSKPMAVTLPFMLLLLDVWPLGRVASDQWRVTRFRIPVPQPSTFNHLLFEKWPYFALTAFFCALTFWIQQTHAAVVPFGNLGFGARLENATLSYVNYLGNFFCPTKLAVFYPYPKSFDGREALLAALLLLAISIFCMQQVSHRPYLAVGWFWFLGMLIPVIGLVQVGSAAMADRYTYLPLIGPAMGLVWLVAEWTERIPARKIVATAAALFLLAACGLAARRQVELWRDTISLFQHAVAVTANNATAQYSLGVGYEQARLTNAAMLQYRIAASMSSADIQPRRSLAQLLCQQGRLAEAADEYNAVLQIYPDDLPSRLALAQTLMQMGKADKAIFQLEMARQFDPDSAEALNNLAWLLATGSDARVRDGARAVQLAERACQLTDYKKTLFVGTLAAAYAEAGRFDNAMATAERAIALAGKNGESALLQKNRELLELYRAHKPYHELR